MNQMLATINTNEGRPVLRILKLFANGNTLEFEPMTQVSLLPKERCVHLCQHQDVFLLTYESGQAEYIRF